MAGSNARSPRPPRNTGPIELRDLGPKGRPLGSDEDCYDGSTWEVLRGELVKQMTAKEIHTLIAMELSVLFRIHASPKLSVMADVYCELHDESGVSILAPDVIVVEPRTTPSKNPAGENVKKTPLLAVEVRAAQSKTRLEEKVDIYLEHDWPEIWCVHTERREVEVLRKGMATVVYRPGSQVPLIPELQTQGLRALPVVDIFDPEPAMQKYGKEWIEARASARTRSSMLLETLLMRGFDISANTRMRISECLDLETLQRWFRLAMTAPNASAFVSAMD